MNAFDIIGPVMIGPSSSHTAGSARIGYFAHSFLGEKAVKADILLHGSFAKTYKGHGTDKAIVAGIMGMQPDDPRLRKSLELAEKEGVEVLFHTGTIPEAHPNTALVTLTGASGKEISVQGESIGGGNIRIVKINGMNVTISGNFDTIIVVHKDAPGAIAAVTKCLSENKVNICNIHLSREEKGGTAVMTIESDNKISAELNEQIETLPHMYSSALIPHLS